MTFETWLALLLASVAMLAIAGPTILLAIGQSPGAGQALRLVAGLAIAAMRRA